METYTQDNTVHGPRHQQPFGAGADASKDKENQDEPAQGVNAKTIILLIAIVGVYFVQVIHLTGIGVLANTITAEIGGADRATWLATTVAITAGTLSPIVSQTADLFGRKWFVVGFTTCGAVGCLIVSRADSFTQLIVGQTIGAFHAGAQCLIHAIASEVMPRKYRTIAQAATATAGGLGGSVGALMSSGLVRHDPTHWRTFFYIVTGMYVAVVTIIIWLYNPPLRELQTKLTLRQKLARLDWTGYLLFVPGLVLFSFALTSSTGIYPWKSAEIIGPLVVGAVMLISFIVYEWKFTNEGMLHHDVFNRNRNFPLVFGLFFVEGLLFYASNSYFSFEIAAVFDKPLFIAGAYYSVGFATLIVITQITGVYCAITKTIREPLIVAYLSFATFCALMASLKTGQSGNPLGYVVLFGVGIGISLNALTATAQLSAPKELISIATGLVIGVRSVGGVVGLAVFSALFSATRSEEVNKKVGQAVSAFPAFNLKDTAALLAALEEQDTDALRQISGVTSQLVAAVGAALQQAALLAFRNIWITAAALAALAAIGSAFLINPKGEFTPSIDAPLESSRKPQRHAAVQMANSHE